jgi:hypothetical protein
MSNSLLTPTVIAKTALMHLDNELVMGNQVYRDDETEFGPTKIGDTVTLRRPVEFEVTDGPTINLQDVIEGSDTMVIDQHKVVSFSFPTKDLTLTIDKFSERYLKDPMIKLANTVDRSLANLYTKIPNWAGTAGQTINSVADFLAGPQRLDENAVPENRRYGVLSPTDWYGLAGTFSGLFVSNIASDALKMAKLPPIGDVDVFKTNNLYAHTVGAHGGTPLTRGASQGVTYSSVKTSMTQTFLTDGWTTNSGLKAGDVFTINDVYDVNPVTKATLSRLKQFVIVSDVTTNTTSSNATTLTIYPAIITTGPYQNVSADNGNDKTITMVGTASTNYVQNMVFHKNAFSLAMVPFAEAPAGSGVAQSTQRHKGLAVTYSSQFDITNFRQVYRLDILYGVKARDPRLATRLSGAS